MFRFKRKIPVPYDAQGYVYFVSKRYRALPADQQRWIEGMCMEAGGEYYQALLEFVSTNAGATAVCEKHFLSMSTLERAVRRYYMLFADNI